MYKLYGQNFERRGMNTITAGIILVGMRHAKESRISSGRLGLWLTCAPGGGGGGLPYETDGDARRLA